LGNTGLDKNEFIQSQKVINGQSKENVFKLVINLLIVNAVVKEHEFVLFVKLLQVNIEPWVEIFNEKESKLGRHGFLFGLHKSVIEKGIDVALEREDFEDVL
jgi:hypothetical protein